MSLRPSLRSGSGAFVGLTPRQRLDPPHDVAPIGSEGFNTAAWAEHHQNVADRLARIGVGVTDGSDAAAGQIGETLIAAADTTISLSPATITPVASLVLSAGDWDAFAGVAFLPTTSAHPSGLGCGVSDVTSSLGPVPTYIAADFTTGIATQFISGPRRFNTAAPLTVYLTVTANWTGGGAITTNGVLRARRMR